MRVLVLVSLFSSFYQPVSLVLTFVFSSYPRANTPSLIDESKRPIRASSSKLPPPPPSRGSDSSDAETLEDDEEDEDFDAASAFDAKKRLEATEPRKPERRLVTKMKASRSLMLAKATAAAAAAVANSKPGSQSSQKAKKKKRQKIRQQQQSSATTATAAAAAAAAASKAAVCKSHREEIGRRTVRNVAARSATAVAAAKTPRASAASTIPPYNASLLDLENISSDDEQRGGSRQQHNHHHPHHSAATSHGGSRDHPHRQRPTGSRRPPHHHHHHHRSSRGGVDADSAGGFVEDTFEERLDRHLATLRLSYINFYKRMQTESFKRSVKAQIAEEEEKKRNLSNSTSKLEKQIQFLIKDSQELLLSRLRELGIEGNTPNDLLVIAHQIVEGHKTLQTRAREEQAAVEALEAEQAALIAALGKGGVAAAAAAASASLESADSVGDGETGPAAPPTTPSTTTTTTTAAQVKNEEVTDACEDPGTGSYARNSGITKLQSHALGMCSVSGMLVC